MYLVEMWCWFRLPYPIEVFHIDQLVVIAKTRVSILVLR